MLSKGDNKMKKVITILSIIGIVGIIITALFYLFILSGAFAVLMPKPPAPQIKYGEFPFTITYEINNEVQVYKDAVICEYEGIESWGTAGKYRKWSRNLKSGNEHIVILKSKENGKSFEIYVPVPGLAEYYMGDFDKRSREECENGMKDDRYLGYKQGEIDHSITKEEALEKYNVKVINIECSPPIENKFK